MASTGLCIARFFYTARLLSLHSGQISVSSIKWPVTVTSSTWPAYSLGRPSGTKQDATDAIRLLQRCTSCICGRRVSADTFLNTYTKIGTPSHLA